MVIEHFDNNGDMKGLTQRQEDDVRAWLDEKGYATDSMFFKTKAEQTAVNGEDSVEDDGDEDGDKDEEDDDDEDEEEEEEEEDDDDQYKR